MQADAIYNFFNNPVTGDSVRALDSYIQEKNMDSKSIKSALELLLKPIPLNQGVNTLESWTGRIRDSNPKPKTCELMYSALDALRFEKGLFLANLVAQNAELKMESLSQTTARTILGTTAIASIITGIIAFPLAVGSFTFAAVGQGAACGLGVEGAIVGVEEVGNRAIGEKTWIQRANLSIPTIPFTIGGVGPATGDGGSATGSIVGSAVVAARQGVGKAIVDLEGVCNFASGEKTKI